jgi:hypothetical protein
MIRARAWFLPVIMMASADSSRRTTWPDACSPTLDERFTAGHLVVTPDLLRAE